MALFLPERQVMNLEIGHAPNIGAPTVRIYLKMRRGYMGQVAFETVTPAFKSEPSAKPDKAPKTDPKDVPTILEKY
jgi:hypothetical protein